MQAQAWRYCNWLLVCTLAGCSPAGPGNGATTPALVPALVPTLVPTGAWPGGPAGGPASGLVGHPANAAAAPVTDDAAVLLLPDLMEWIVDPAAAVLAAAVVQHSLAATAPRSDEAWQAVADAAAALQGAGDLLAAPVLARGQADWLGWSVMLKDGATAAAAAARRHDPRSLYMAGLQVRQSCLACHASHARHLAADVAAGMAANSAEDAVPHTAGPGALSPLR